MCKWKTLLQIQVLLEPATYISMRKGEILALTWAGIAFDWNTVPITKSAPPVKEKILIETHKIKSSRRMVSTPTL